MGFSSGSENPHGVKAVTRGQRCAIALWFTLDPRHSERVSSLPPSLPPGSMWGFWVGQWLCSPPWVCPQERVQADDLVKMLFGMEEEGVLEPEAEKESSPPVVRKDEL